MPDASATAEAPPDLLHQLSATGFRSIVHKLYKEVPSPDTDDPAEIALLVDAAIAAVASMLPANIDEAMIAARAVSADAQASDCIRHARQLFDEPAGAMRCHAQACHMMRTANAARALLLRLQTVRRKREATPGNCDQDAWTEHCAAGLMAAARDTAPAPEPSPPPASPPPEAADADTFVHHDATEPGAVADASRAAGVRVHGGVPPTAGRGHPEPEPARAPIAAASPSPQEFHQPYARTVPA